jgi:hypothetical protein
MSELAKDLLRRIFLPPTPKNRLPLGRCACGEPTVRWCTRHGRPLRIRGQGRNLFSRT